MDQNGAIFIIQQRIEARKRIIHANKMEMAKLQAVLKSYKEGTLEHRQINSRIKLLNSENISLEGKNRRFQW